MGWRRRTYEPKKSMNTTLRTPETEEAYQRYLLTGDKDCCFCRELDRYKNSPFTAIKRTWGFWMLMQNEYPYDRVYTTHDMLAPLRHVDWQDLTVKEVTEYNRIMNELRGKYQQLVENLGDRQSQPGHYHIHLAKCI